MKKFFFVILLASFIFIIVVNNKIMNKDISSIRNVVNYLCSDEIKDREFKSDGNQKASEYINNLYQKMNLEFVFEESYINSFYCDGIKINNVLGKISGENNKKVIILTAHFDAWCNGAVDNASGVSAVIEIAKNLKEFSETNKLNQDVIFLMTNAEMNGFKGSEDFVLKLSELNYENVYNINIDCIGIKDSFNSSGLGLKNLSHLEESKKLYSGIEEVFKEYKIGYTDDFSTEKSKSAYEQGYGVSDYVTFEQNGYPNIHIAQKDLNGFILNENDDPNLIDYRKIKEISEALSQYIKEVDFSKT